MLATCEGHRDSGGTWVNNCAVCEIDLLRTRLAEIREVWAGAEVGVPIYAQEAYAIRLCKQMYRLACEALKCSEE